MKTLRVSKIIFSVFVALIITISFVGYAGAASLGQNAPPEDYTSQIEVISPYFSLDHRTTPSGQQLTGAIINGPSRPLPEYQAEREASMTAITPDGILANFPSYDWVFGCSAVSGAMIAAWYDRGAFPNLYTGPTDGGLMPITDTGWSTWSDNIETYPNNPLVASHNGVDGRTIRGSIDDYWIRFNSELPDPYISGGWTQHNWGSAIGDYMKTSQSAYGNKDGATVFYTWTSSPNKLTCADMVGQNVSTLDGTYGRKQFYEARGYSVGDCYNQKTDNNSGNFTLEDYKAEIDAGHPVLINLNGHSIVGYGYNGSTVYIRDTWDSNPAHTYAMSWGGIYQGMEMISVSVVHIGERQITSKVFLPLIQKPAPTPPVNPFLNSGFEAGSTSWDQSSTNGWDLILVGEDYGIPAHGGDWLAWLGGGNDETSLLSQTINISASAPYLHFWYWSASADVCGYDYFYVGVNGSYFYSETLCSTNNTGGWVERVVNLSAYVGSGKTVQFKVTTDVSNNSNVFLDDISMSASASTSHAEQDGGEGYPEASMVMKK